MSSSLVITLAVIGGVAWLAFLGVSALRTRGKEQVPQNLARGRSDEELETSRLERFQQVAVLLSGFMAVSLPLYFLGETERQDELRRSVPRGVGRRVASIWSRSSDASRATAPEAAGAAPATSRSAPGSRCHGRLLR